MAGGSLGSAAFSRAKVLGQIAAASTTEETLYTVPADTTAKVWNVFIANRTGGALTYRLYVAVAGAATATKMYLTYDLTIAANDFRQIAGPIHLGPTDVVRTYASATGLSFNVFGEESPITSFQ